MKRNLTFTTAMVVLMHGFALAADAPTTRPDGVDLSTPRAAVMSYLQAIQRLDIAAANEAAVRSQKTDDLIAAVIAEGKARQQYLDAAKKKFGADQVLAPDLTTFLLGQVKQAEVRENGDTASVGDFPCRKVPGKWRFHLVRHNPDAAQLDAVIKYLADSTAAYNKFTPTIAGGKWKTFDEMDQARPAPRPPEPKN